MQVSVVDVGDGAATAIDCVDHGPEQLTVIDSGVYFRGDRLPADAAADLALVVGRRLSDLSTLIVTHFDADHWNGLLELAYHYQRSRPAADRTIRLFYPGLSAPWASDVRAALAAFITVRANENQPLDVARLLARWRAVTRQVTNHPLYQGQCFWANGHRWVVHWPPRELPTRRRTSIEQWLNEVDSLADEMAQDKEEGSTRFRDILDEAYRTDGEAGLDGEQLHEQASSTLEVEPASDDGDFDGDDEDSADGHHWVDERDVSFDDDPALPVIPSKYRQRFNELAGRAKGIDNYLSLVFSEVNGLFLDFGDIEGGARSALLRSGRLGPNYRMMLAPHHGTHGLVRGTRLPTSPVCVAQNGKYFAKWEHIHVSAHGQAPGWCSSTKRRGTRSFQLRCCLTRWQEWAPDWPAHRSLGPCVR